MKKIAVVLAGNGVYDGAEIHETTLTLLSIVRNGARYQCFAPDIQQAHVVNHLTGEEMPEKRNVLIEAARIARGNIKPLSEYSAKDFDAIVFPGGFGAAKNFCTFAFDGVDCKVNPDVEKAVRSTVAAKKPIGAWCISPVMMVKFWAM
jgi:enhancing lycopene biosynthesis protein 2